MRGVWSILVGGSDGLSVIDFELAVGEAFEEQSSVGFGEHSRVQYDDSPSIISVSDESAEALFEFDDGFGCLVVAERVSAAIADDIKSGFEERVIGYAEGQFGDDHVLQCFAGNIDTLPEAVCSEQYGSIVLLEFFQHGGSGESFSLAVECEVL